MNNRKDIRIDNAEIAFNNHKLDKQVLLNVICESIASIIKNKNSFDNVKIVRFADIKNSYSKDFQKEGVFQWQSKAKQNELLFMQDTQVICNEKRA
ncbi:MAG: hypothetical protein IKM66_08975 [Clostridia bacterium]|nr:hypothetical protein [Clostridia bacterium]